MAGFLDIMGTMEAALGVGGFPEPGSSVIFELWMIDDKPKIKVSIQRFQRARTNLVTEK